MNISDFLPLLKHSFKISFTDQDLELKLIEVRSEGVPFKEGARQPFSLLFSADAANGVLRQGTYPVHNQTLGETHVFLIPRGIENQICQYEAIYN